ncbi:MAG: hypothetical protein HY717_16100 [Planctomycetes bacterium]|nr:hypothetical protein [Planctomycetota bacterium]
MGKAMVIISSSVIFCLLGQVAGYVAADYLKERQNFDSELLLLILLASPALGAVFGLILGLVAAKAGKWPENKE